MSLMRQQMFLNKGIFEKDFFCDMKNVKIIQIKKKMLKQMH